VRGDRIAIKIFTPLSVPLDHTKQRWIARREYEDAKMLCIFSHGNAEDLCTSGPYSQWLADEFNMNVVSYDYKGYGNSEAGLTSEDNMNEAIESVFDLAVTRMRVPKKGIVLLGKSIGTGPTVFLASRGHNIAGIVLVSPIASGARVMAGSSHIPGKLLQSVDGIFMPSIQRIVNVEVPVCIIHGEQDTIVDIQNAKALHECCGPRAAYPALYVQAGHNDIEKLHRSEFVEHVSHFIQHTRNVWSETSLRPD